MIILSQKKGVIYNTDVVPCIYATSKGNESAIVIQTGAKEEYFDVVGAYDSPTRAKEVLRELYNDWINGIKWFEVPET